LVAVADRIAGGKEEDDGCGSDGTKGEVDPEAEAGRQLCSTIGEGGAYRHVTRSVKTPPRSGPTTDEMTKTKPNI
jgi:hypothetical protein